MAQYDYEKFFSTVEFDFFDNPDLAIYVEDIKFAEETPDYIVLNIDFSLYGDVTAENLDQWREEFVDDLDSKFEMILEVTLEDGERFAYFIKQKMRFYLDKDILNDCLLRESKGERGEVDLQDIIKMIVTISYESKMESDTTVIGAGFVDHFDNALGFPIPEDPTCLVGVFEFGV